MAWRLRRRSCEKKEAGWRAKRVQHEKFDKRLAQEEAWLRQGIKARRTRDEGRVRALLAMREERAERRDQIGTVRLQAESADRSGQMVFEAEDVRSHSATGPIVRDSSMRVMRGDRVGLIGPNGSGKTTLLRMLLGELEPDAGEVRRGDERADRVLRPAARAARPRAHGVRDRRRRQRHRDRERQHAARSRLPARLPVSARARAIRR